MKKKWTVGALAVALMFSPVAASVADHTTTQPTYSAPTNTFGSSAYSVSRTAQGMTFDGKVTGHKNVTLRISASPITTQTGWYYNAPVNADGTVRIAANEQGTGKHLYWQLESATDRNNIIVSGQLASAPAGTTPAPTPTPTPTPTPEPTPTPSPVTPPATGGDFTNGSGGAKTVQMKRSFTSSGLTSNYHLYAEGLDWSKKVGIIVYGDGSGGHGFDNPTQNYLLGGPTGLAAVAKKHNMILLVPEAPAPGCDGYDNCWYDSNGANKAKWSADLVRKIHGEYNIDKSRTVIGGYSSGAQWSSQFFGPGHAPALMTDGLIVPISYGGAPRVTSTYTAEFKKNVAVSWDVGANDGPALSSARSGQTWYKNNGFAVAELNVVPNKGHGRGGEFAGIVDREIIQHVKPA